MSHINCKEDHFSLAKLAQARALLAGKEANLAVLGAFTGNLLPGS